MAAVEWCDEEMMVALRQVKPLSELMVNIDYVFINDN
jgi:hypothetical protein